MDGNGRLNYIRRLTIVSDLSEAVSPDASAWLKDNPYGERLVLHDMRQDATAILLPDFAIEGPVNMRYGKHFTATAYGKREDVEELWTKYRGMAENMPSLKPARVLAGGTGTTDDAGVLDGYNGIGTRNYQRSRLR
jgi:hypothetical protein